jgi:hypothetical protein
MFETAMVGDNVDEDVDVPKATLSDLLGDQGGFHEEENTEGNKVLDLTQPLPDHVSCQILQLNGDFLEKEGQLHNKLTMHRDKEISAEDIGTVVEYRLKAGAVVIEESITNNYKSYKAAFGSICRQQVTDRQITDTVDRILNELFEEERQWNNFLDKLSLSWTQYKESHERIGIFPTREDQEAFFASATIRSGYGHMMSDNFDDAPVKVHMRPKFRKIPLHLLFKATKAYTWWDANGWLVLSRQPKPVPVKVISVDEEEDELIWGDKIVPIVIPKVTTDGPTAVVPSKLLAVSSWNKKLVVPVPPLPPTDSK